MIHSDLWQELKHEIEGRLVYRAEDEWGELFVVDHKDNRLLYFGAPYEQSCIYRDKPHQPVHEYARAMLLVLAFTQPADVVMLGLGGGTLLHALLRAHPASTVSIVELRGQVVDIAKHYFQLPFLSDANVKIADAKQYLRTLPADSCDLLFADLFSDSAMLPWQQQHKFFSACQKVLREDGWLVINFDQYQEPGGSSIHSLCSLFPTVLSFLTRDGNNVILATRQDSFEPADALSAVKQLEQSLETPLIPLLSDLMILSG